MIVEEPLHRVQFFRKDGIHLLSAFDQRPTNQLTPSQQLKRIQQLNASFNSTQRSQGSVDDILHHYFQVFRNHLELGVTLKPRVGLNIEYFFLHMMVD